MRVPGPDVVSAATAIMNMSGSQIENNDGYFLTYFVLIILLHI